MHKPSRAVIGIAGCILLLAGAILLSTTDDHSSHLRITSDSITSKLIKAEAECPEDLARSKFDGYDCRKCCPDACDPTITKQAKCLGVDSPTSVERIPDGGAFHKSEMKTDGKIVDTASEISDQDHFDIVADQEKVVPNGKQVTIGFCWVCNCPCVSATFTPSAAAAPLLLFVFLLVLLLILVTSHLCFVFCPLLLLMMMMMITSSKLLLMWNLFLFRSCPDALRHSVCICFEFIVNTPVFI